jgi:menaquinone-specific isochorismate synthase
VTHVPSRAATAHHARSFTVEPPARLVDRLGPRGFAWLPPGGGFVTSGVAATVSLTDAPAFLRALPHAADDDVPAGAGPRAVGALPFGGPPATGALTVPALTFGVAEDGRAWCTVVEPAPGAPPLRVAPRHPTRFVVESCTPPERWHEMVHAVLRDIARGLVEKVVLSRAVRVEADEPFDVRAILERLRRMQPGCTVYGDGGFVGASPELLVCKRGDAVVSRPLAGTGTDADALLASRKDAHEHRVVVDAVVKALATRCDDVRAEGPAALVLADVTHLATTVSARARPGTTVADLVAELHPTPAVAGAPRGRALERIGALEPFDRGGYGGACGWVDARGDGAFVVALRGAAIEGTTALLHAGAGIVAGSAAEAEWLETEQKLEPMLRALVRP